MAKPPSCRATPICRFGTPARALSTCKGRDAKLIVSRDAIDLAEDGRAPRRVVTVEGSRPGWLWFRERAQPIWAAGFLEGCRYVVFSFHFRYYLLDLATGSIGRIPGYPLRPLTAYASSTPSLRSPGDQ